MSLTPKVRGLYGDIRLNGLIHFSKVKKKLFWKLKLEKINLKNRETIKNRYAERKKRRMPKTNKITNPMKRISCFW